MHAERQWSTELKQRCLLTLRHMLKSVTLKEYFVQIASELRYDGISYAQNSCNSVCSNLTASSSVACVCLMLACLYACNCSVTRNK